MRSIILFLALHALVQAITGQKLLTMEDAITGTNTKLAPQSLPGIQWTEKEKEFSYLVNYQNIIIENAETGKTTSVLSLQKLNKQLQGKGMEQLNIFFHYKWISDNKILFIDSGNYYVYNTSDSILQHVFDLPEKAENPQYSADQNAMAYTIENNIEILFSTGKTIRVTDFKDKNIVAGNDVSRREFGIRKGIFWSPKGNYLAFYRKDESNVTDYPLVNIESRIATLENIKYPMAGERSENVSLGIYSLAGQNTVYLENNPESEEYITSVTWAPGEEKIYFAKLNREQNHLRFNAYQVTTGKYLKTLFEEKNEKYVEPEAGAYFLKNNPDKFIWQSERDGYNHLYLYNTSGVMLRQLTEGTQVITEIIGFDPAKNLLFYESTGGKPLERQLFSVNINNGKSKQLTEESGTFKGKLSPEGDFIITVFESFDTPNKIDLITGKGKMVRNLFDSPNPLAGYNMPEMEVTTIKAADEETDLYLRTIKPLNFDSAQTYPVIVYVYGGPHAQLITNSWLGGARLWQYYMAQRGYLVVTLDNRGSESRGFNFESIIHRQLGVAEMADQMKAVEFLATLPYADTSRIGLHGWSYGGFMTMSLMINHPGIFKVGVAGGPVTDWKYYEVMYGERYMDTPAENPDGYERTNINLRAGELKDHLLIIHGAIDPTVVWQQSLVFINNAIKQNIPVDYFVYPRHEHNVRGNDRIHLMQKVTDYFEVYL